MSYESTSDIWGIFKYQEWLLFCLNMRQRNSNSGNLSTILFANQTTTTTVAMEIKYLHVGRYFKLAWDATCFNQSPFRNYLACIIIQETLRKCFLLHLTDNSTPSHCPCSQCSIEGLSLEYHGKFQYVCDYSRMVNRLLYSCLFLHVSYPDISDLELVNRLSHGQVDLTFGR